MSHNEETSYNILKWYIIIRWVIKVSSGTFMSQFLADQVFFQPVPFEHTMDGLAVDLGF